MNMLQRQASLYCLLAALLSSAWPVSAADKNKPVPRTDKPKAEVENTITLNFVNAEIEAVARTFRYLDSEEVALQKKQQADNKNRERK